MQEIMKLAHEFLQNFCTGNQQNQALLHKHINLFLNPGVSVHENGKKKTGWLSWGTRVNYLASRASPDRPDIEDKTLW